MFRVRFKASLLTVLAVMALFVADDARSESAACGSIHRHALNAVGNTRMQVLLFKVYDAYLYTNTGVYPDYDDLELELNYLRTIKSVALVNATAEEWNKQGFTQNEQSTAWLEQLKNMWPDVSSGDCLVAQHSQGKGISFYNKQGFLGEVKGQEFAEQFLAIWLSSKSSFRRNRNELVGLN